MRAIRPDADGGYLAGVLGTDFTADQLRIATAPLGPQLVVAGAGSGKTTVMAARVVHAVAVQGVAPAQVLGLTFTNKAAGQLARKIREALVALGRAELLPAVADGEPDPLDELPTVSTYHAYAAGIVRDHALRIGREPVATLLGEAARWQLATRVVRAATGPFGHLDVTTPTVVDRVLALAGELAEHLVVPEDVRRADAALLAGLQAVERPTQAVRDAIAAAGARAELLGLVERYDAAKRDRDLLDFGDQVALAARIVAAAPAVAAAERSRFRLVVLDEYQDTGVAQRLLLSTLFRDHPVVAVGDPNQSIYGWRGASIGNLLRFGSHFRDAKVQQRDGALEPQPLMTSFRCGGRILAAANAVGARIGQGLAWRPPLEVRPLTARPGCDDSGEVVAARLATDADEAEWIADVFAADIAGGRSPGEFAVLCRRRADFPRMHRALLARDLPVEVVGLGGLLTMPEVADVVAVLRVLHDPAANAAAVHLLTGPRWRIGIRDLAALGHRAGRLSHWRPDEIDDEAAAGTDLAAALAAVTASVDPVDVPALLDAVESPGAPDAYSAEARDRFSAVHQELRLLRRLSGQPLVELVTDVVRTIGLDVELEAETAAVAAGRAANLAAFLDQAAAFTGLDGESDLPAFLAYLEAAETAEDGFDIGGVSSADSIKLLTVHKAKGLEWDVVAVPGLTATTFPSNRRRPIPTRAAQVLPGRLRGDAVDLPHLSAYEAVDLKAYKSDCDRESDDEERRLAYVAFTRARERLLLSSACWSATRKTPAAVSPYLTEVLALGEPVVRVEQWCDDPSAEEANPLQALAQRDIAWPVSPDEQRLVRLRAAAAAVEAAKAALPATTTGTGTAMAGQQVMELGAGLSLDEQADVVLDELRRARAPQRDVPLPARLTASQVVQLAHDPGSLARSIARPVPQRPAARARRGSRFHAWVESLWQASPLLDTDDLPGAGDAALGDPELAELQRRFVADGWADRRPHRVEQPFELVVAGRLLRGRIDAVYATGDGGFDVVDYKTGELPADPESAALQLSVYRLAWADLAEVEPARVTAGFLYVRTGELRRPAQLLGRDDLAALLEGRGTSPVPAYNV